MCDGHLTIFKFTKSCVAVLGTPGFDDYTLRHLLQFLPSFRTEEEARYWAERHPDALRYAENAASLSKDYYGVGPIGFRCVHYQPGVTVDCDQCSEKAIHRGWARPSVAAAGDHAEDPDSRAADLRRALDA